MWPYLIGGGVGAAGIIAALWFRYKLAVSQGETKAQKLLTAEAKAKEESAIAAEVKAIAETKDELARRDAELAVHVATEEKLRELLRTCTDPAVVAHRVGLLFAPKTGNGNP